MKRILIMIFSVFVISASAQTWWTYPELGNAAAQSIIETENGYVLSGGTFLYAGGVCYLARIDKSNGELDWFHLYRGRYSCGQKVVETPDNSFVILSTIDLWDGNLFWLIKTNTLGETIWTKTIAPQNQPVAQPYCLAFFLPDSGFILGGRDYEGGRIILARTNQNGETLWTRRGVARETLYLGMEIRNLLTKRNKIYLLAIAAVPWPSGAFHWRTILAEINENGNLTWKREYLYLPSNPPGSLIGTNFCLLENYFLIAGFGYYPSAECFAFLLKTDTLGNEIWRKLYRLDSLGWYRSIPVAVWKNGNNTISIPVQLYDSSFLGVAGLLKTDLEGNLINIYTYPYPNNHSFSLRDAIPTSDGNILLAGRVSWSSPPGYTAICKTPLTGISEEVSCSPLSRCFKIFTNPSLGIVNFQLPVGQTDDLKIYDASGRLLFSKTIRKQLQLKLSPGIYFYQLKNQTGKIIILGSN